MTFRVELEEFRGPLDLLLYLVRKHEVEVTDIPIALITVQYLDSLAEIEELDVDGVGDFLEMASTLLEIKSRLVLPQDGEEPDQVEDPRDELVHHLLEYKQYRDAASLLEEQSREWQQHFARQADDVPTRRVDLGSQPIQEVELWDLVSALGRILRENQATKPSNIIYDDTPIDVYMERIHRELAQKGRASLSQWLSGGMHKSAMIGVFLAVLELVRHHGVRTEQNDLHGEICVLPGEHFESQAEFAGTDSYGGDKENPVKPR
jgi:segregation and condensation protein A